MLPSTQNTLQPRCTVGLLQFSHAIELIRIAKKIQTPRKLLIFVNVEVLLSQLLVVIYFQCEPGLAALVMYDLLYTDPRKLLLLAGCSTVCTTIAETAKMWNLNVVSKFSNAADCSR